MGANPKAEVEISAHSRNLGAKLREARAKFGAFGAELKNHVFGKDLVGEKGGFWGKGGAQMVGNLGSSAVQNVSSFLADQGREVLGFQERLTRFQIIAGRTPEEMEEMRQSILAVSKETAIASDQVLAGAQTYVDLTGDVAGAATAMYTFARIAQASESSIQDIATSAAALQDSLKIKPEELESTFSGLIAQGKAGAVNTKDYAAELTGLAPRFARFGVIGREGAIELGAMFQVGRKGFKDAAETATGMEAMFHGLTLHAKKFQAAGVQIFDRDPKTGEKRFRKLSDILDGIAHSRLAKDPTLLTKAFGRGEGEQFYRMLADHLDMLRQLEQAGEDTGSVQRDLATYMQSSSGRIAASWNDVKLRIAEAMTPERIEAFTSALEQGLPVVADFVEAFAKLNAFTFGGLMNLGKSIRGVFDSNTNNNPFSDVAEQTDTERRYRLSRGLPIDAGQQKNFELAHANKDAYDRAASEIMGAEVNDRTSPASIQRAVLAKYASLNSPGGAGENLAGRAYLDSAKIPEAAQAEIFAKAVGAAFKDSTLAHQIVDAIREGFNGAKTEVKADGKAIVDVHRGSAAHARRPGGG